MKRGTINIFSILLSALSIIALSVYVIWGSNKGIDLSDESLYLNGYSNLIEKKFSVHGFTFFVTQTFSKFNTGIVYFRILRLVLTLVSSIVLAYSFAKWLKQNYSQNKKIHFVEIAILSCFAGFTSYAFGPQTLSYNHLTLVFGNLFIAMLFELSLCNNFRKRLMLEFGIAAIIGFEFFVRFPQSFLFFITYVIYLLLEDKKNIKSFIIDTAFVLLAIIIVIVAVCIPFNSIAVISEFINEIAKVSSQTLHEPLGILKKYWQGAVYVIIHTQKIALDTIFVLVSLIGLNFAQKKQYQLLFFGLFILAFSHFVYSCYSNHYFSSGYSHRYTESIVHIIIFIFFTVLYVTSSFREKATAKNIVSLRFYFTALLFVFPIIALVGTNNYIHVNITFHLNAWFLLFYFIYALHNEHQFLKTATVCLLVLCGVKSCFDVYGGISDAYRINTTIFEQKFPVYAKNTNETIYVDQATKANITAIEKLITKYKPQIMFSSFDFFGISYLQNLKSPSYGCTDCVSMKSDFICENLNNSELLKENSCMFVLTEVEKKCDFISCVAAKIKPVAQFKWKTYWTDSVFIYMKE